MSYYLSPSLCPERTGPTLNLSNEDTNRGDSDSCDGADANRGGGDGSGTSDDLGGQGQTKTQEGDVQPDRDGESNALVILICHVLIFSLLVLNEIDRHIDTLECNR